jgi:hypothetical protein
MIPQFTRLIVDPFGAFSQLAQICHALSPAFRVPFLLAL